MASTAAAPAWQKLEASAKNQPIGSEGTSLCAYDEAIFLFGGLNASKGRLNVLTAFDTTTKQWNQLKKTNLPPPGRCYHLSWVYGGKMFVFSGEGDFVKEVRECHVDLWALHGLDTDHPDWRNHQMSGDFPPARLHVSGVAWNGKLVTWGGHSASLPVTYSRDVFVLDLATLRWTKQATKGTVPPAAHGHASALVGNKMYVLGGSSPSSRPNTLTVDVLDLEAWEWTSLSPAGPDVPAARMDHAVCAIGPRIYVVGGRDALRNILPDVYVLNTVTNTWTRLPGEDTYPFRRAGHSLAALGATLYCFGGLNDTGYCTSELWALETGRVWQVEAELHGIDPTRLKDLGLGPYEPPPTNPEALRRGGPPRPWARAGPAPQGGPMMDAGRGTRGSRRRAPPRRRPRGTSSASSPAAATPRARSPASRRRWTGRCAGGGGGAAGAEAGREAAERELRAGDEVYGALAGARLAAEAGLRAVETVFQEEAALEDELAAFLDARSENEEARRELVRAFSAVLAHYREQAAEAAAAAVLASAPQAPAREEKAGAVRALEEDLAALCEAVEYTIGERAALAAAERRRYDEFKGRCGTGGAHGGGAGEGGGGGRDAAAGARAGGARRTREAHSLAAREAASLKGDVEALKAIEQQARDAERKRDELTWALAEANARIAGMEGTVAGQGRQMEEIVGWAEDLIINMAPNDAERQRARLLLDKKIGVWRGRQKALSEELAKTEQARRKFEADIRLRLQDVQADFEARVRAQAEGEKRQRDQLAAHYEGRAAAERQAERAAEDATRAEREVKAAHQAAEQARRAAEAARAEAEAARRSAAQSDAVLGRLGDIAAHLHSSMSQVIEEARALASGRSTTPASVFTLAKRADEWMHLVALSVREVEKRAIGFVGSSVVPSEGPGALLAVPSGPEALLKGSGSQQRLAPASPSPASSVKKGLGGLQPDKSSSNRSRQNSFTKLAAVNAFAKAPAAAAASRAGGPRAGGPRAPSPGTTNLNAASTASLWAAGSGGAAAAAMGPPRPASPAATFLQAMAQHASARPATAPAALPVAQALLSEARETPLASKATRLVGLLRSLRVAEQLEEKRAAAAEEHWRAGRRRARRRRARAPAPAPGPSRGPGVPPPPRATSPLGRPYSALARGPAPGRSPPRAPPRSTRASSPRDPRPGLLLQRARGAPGSPPRGGAGAAPMFLAVSPALAARASGRRRGRLASEVEEREREAQDREEHARRLEAIRAQQREAIARQREEALQRAKEEAAAAALAAAEAALNPLPSPTDHASGSKRRPSELGGPGTQSPGAPVTSRGGGKGGKK
eukprot:tig00000691_g3182.t1